MAIMQSLGEGRSGSGSYLFENEMMSESFIEQQKFIEAQLRNKRRK
jgi:hypothetical protein